jgi:hypothetical protein
MPKNRLLHPSWTPSLPPPNSSCARWPVRNPLDAAPLAEALADAATAAIASGQPIADVARAEQRGQQQARAALSRDLLARVERAARTGDHGGTLQSQDDGTPIREIVQT